MTSRVRAGVDCGRDVPGIKSNEVGRGVPGLEDLVVRMCGVLERDLSMG